MRSIIFGISLLTCTIIQAQSHLVLSDIKTILHQVMIHEEVENDIYYSSADEVKRDTTFHVNHFRIYSPKFEEDFYHGGVYVLAYNKQRVYFDTNHVLVQECFDNLLLKYEVVQSDTHAVVELFDSVLIDHIHETWFEFRIAADNPRQSKKGYDLASLHIIEIDQKNKDELVEIEYVKDGKSIIYELKHTGNQWKIISYDIHDDIEEDSDF